MNSTTIPTTEPAFDNRKLGLAFFLLTLAHAVGLFNVMNLGMLNNLVISTIAITGALLLLSATRADKPAQAAGWLIIAVYVLPLAAWVISVSGMFGSPPAVAEDGILGVLNLTNLSPLQATIMTYTTFASNVFYLLAVGLLIFSPTCKPVQLLLFAILLMTVCTNMLIGLGWGILERIGMRFASIDRIISTLTFCILFVKVGLYLLSTYILFAPHRAYRLNMASLLCLSVGFVGTMVSPIGAAPYTILAAVAALLFWVLGATLLSVGGLRLRTTFLHLYWLLLLLTIVCFGFLKNVSFLLLTLQLLCTLFLALGVWDIRKYPAKSSVLLSIKLLIACAAYTLICLLTAADFFTGAEGFIFSYVLTAVVVLAAVYAWYRLLRGVNIQAEG